MSPAVRNAIVAKIAGVVPTPHVFAFERFAKRPSDLRRLFEADGRIHGYLVRRISVTEEAHTSHINREVTTWQVRGYRSLDDDSRSEILFDTEVDAVRAAFRTDDTLGGAVETTTVEGKVGLQLDDSGPVMFAGHLCHSVRMTLRTLGDIDAGLSAAGVFETFHADWDVPAHGDAAPPLPASEPDAADTVTLETE